MKESVERRKQRYLQSHFCLALSSWKNKLSASTCTTSTTFTVVFKYLKLSEHKWYQRIVFILWQLGFKWTEHWLFHTLKCKNLHLHVYSRHNLDENIARWCRERHSCTHKGGTIKLGNKYTSAMLYRRNDGNFHKLFLAICCSRGPVITQ